MLRPRESRDLRLVSCHVTVAPAAVVTWAQDVFGNAVATAAAFQNSADTLSIDSVAELELVAAAWPVFDIAAEAICFPFRYTDDAWTDLQRAADRFHTQASEEGTPVAEVCRKAGVSGATYYNWRKKYGGLMPSEMKRLKQLEERSVPSISPRQTRSISHMENKFRKRPERRGWLTFSDGRRPRNPSLCGAGITWAQTRVFSPTRLAARLCSRKG